MNDDIHPRLQEVLSDLADEFDMPESQIVTAFERRFGIDLADVDDDDAEKFADALEDGDQDTVAEVLREYGVSDEMIQEFEQVAADLEDENPDDVAERVESEGNVGGESGDTGQSQTNTDGDAPSRDEVRQMIRDEVPSGDEIAASLQDQMGATGGTDAADGESGGDQAQQRMVMELVKTFAQDSGGGGPMAEMGEKATEKVMERSMQRLARPSIGEIIGQKIEENIAENVAEDVAGDVEWREEAGEEALESDGDGSDDDGGIWSW